MSRPLGGRRVRDRIAKVSVARPSEAPSGGRPSFGEVQTLDDLAEAVNDLIDLVGDFDFGGLP